MEVHGGEHDALKKALLEVVRVLDGDADPESLVATALEPLQYEPPRADPEPEDWTIGIGNTFA